MKKVYLYVRACGKRELDIAMIYDYFKKNNYKIVNSPNNSDIILFVTCAVLDDIANFNLEIIKSFQKYDAELIVAGCLPEIEKEKLSKIFNGKILNTKNLEKIDEFFPENKITFKEIKEANIPVDVLNKTHSKRIVFKIKWLNVLFTKVKVFFAKHIYKDGSHIFTAIIRPNNYFIRISWGCLGNCSYCAIKKAIGTFRSKPINDCIQELRRGINAGYKKITIVASDTGAYGLDIGLNFPELLKEMTELHGDYKLILRDIAPKWFIKYYNNLENIFKSGKIYSMDIPIQSGSKKILKLMHRSSNTEDMIKFMRNLNESFPDIRLNTHAIIGFPSETEEDFMDTLNFFKKVNFYGGYIYPYSCKSGTVAEDIFPKNSKKVISSRMKFTKKFLENLGYKVVKVPKANYFLFNKKQ